MPEQEPHRGLLPAVEAIRRAGRNGDTVLAHISPKEAARLKRDGGAGTINPSTGLPEFFDPGDESAGGQAGTASNNGSGNGTDGRDSDTTGGSYGWGTNYQSPRPAPVMVTKLENIPGSKQARNNDKFEREIDPANDRMNQRYADEVSKTFGKGYEYDPKTNTMYSQTLAQKVASFFLGAIPVPGLNLKANTVENTGKDRIDASFGVANAVGGLLGGPIGSKIGSMIDDKVGSKVDIDQAVGLYGQTPGLTAPGTTTAVAANAPVTAAATTKAGVPSGDGGEYSPQNVVHTTSQGDTPLTSDRVRGLLSYDDVDPNTNTGAGLLSPSERFRPGWYL